MSSLVPRISAVKAFLVLATNILPILLFLLSLLVIILLRGAEMFRRFASPARFAMDSRRFDTFFADVAMSVSGSVLGRTDAAFGAMTIGSSDPTVAFRRRAELVIRFRKMNQRRFDVGEEPDRRAFLVSFLGVLVILEHGMILVENFIVEHPKFRPFFLDGMLEEIRKSPERRQKESGLGIGAALVERGGFGVGRLRIQTPRFQPSVGNGTHRREDRLHSAAERGIDYDNRRRRTRS